MRALHGYSLLGAGAGNDVWRLPLPLQSLLDGGSVGRQVGQLVENVPFADDCVNQIAVPWRRQKEEQIYYTKETHGIPSNTIKQRIFKFTQAHTSATSHIFTIKLVLDDIIESLK